LCNIPVLLGEGIHELREDIPRHNGLSKIVAIVGEPAKRKGRGLLDRRNAVDQKRTQKRKDTGRCQRLDVLPILVVFVIFQRLK
jgi:hypothetical protein